MRRERVFVALFVATVATALAFGIIGRPASTPHDHGGRVSGDIGIGPVLPGNGSPTGGGSFNGLTLATGAGVTGTGSAGSALSINVANDYAGKHLEYIDEWCLPATTASGGNYKEWQSSITSTGVTQTGTSGTTSRPCIDEMQISTTAGSRAAWNLNVNAFDFSQYSKLEFEAVLGVPVLSNATDDYVVLVGFGDVVAGQNQTDGCYFMYDRLNSATGGPNSGNADKWECWCAANNVRTTFLMDGSTVSNETFTTVNEPVAALTLPNTNIFHLLVRMTSTTRAEFFVNGTKACDINTNIPSGSSRLTGAMIEFLRTGGTTNARTLELDWTRIALDLNSSRSP